jgi:hypothetical protein
MSVARFAKLLVRARWKVDPGFLPPGDLERWGLGNIAADPCPAWRLLARAADDLVALHDEYLGRCPSGGVPIMDRDTPEGHLVANTAVLADPFNSGPCDDRGLRVAASELRGGGTVDWRLVDWDLLGLIRDGLDRLPLSPRSAGTPARSSPPRPAT